MKITVLSHAGLLVEDGGSKLVMDPWIIGSCYWRSWWNFPPPPPELIEGLQPDAVYLTHLHWDHFHGASLRRFDRSTKIYVPRVNLDRMVKDLEWLGFHNVEEIPHGGTVRLPGGLELTSYQVGHIVDSTCVVTDGRTTLLNANDCKLFGAPLREVVRRHAPFDFVLRSHSSASPVPYCIEGYRESHPERRTAQDYAEEFTRFCLSVGARYAIPFASNHCFLHRETRHFNETAVSPDMVREHYQRRAAELGAESECVIMAAGSSWSDDEGFAIREFDYSRKEEAIEELARQHAATLERQYELEDAELADYAAFSGYFGGLLRSLPLGFGWLCPMRVRFDVEDREGVHSWLLDFVQRRVSECDGGEAAEVVIACPAKVVNDCSTIRMFATWTPSKRLRVRLSDPAEVKKLEVFLNVLDFYELEMLPLWKNFRLRSLGVRLRRWRDVVEVLSLVWRYRVLKRPFSLAALYPLRTPVEARQS